MEDGERSESSSMSAAAFAPVALRMLHSAAVAKGFRETIFAE
jgi:hypothetical protein